jgi:hypothetical protein
MNKKLWNWRLWVGFVVAMLALIVYFTLFYRTREVVWLSVAIFIVSAVLFVSGLRRAFRQRESHRGQVAGPILAALSALVLALFGFTSYEMPRHIAVANNAPKVGEAAPQFTLVDAAGKTVSLASALASPLGPAQAPKAVLLVFYRGYW